MSKNGEDIESIIDYISESLKNKLAHDTTIKLKSCIQILMKIRFRSLMIYLKKTNESGSAS